MAGPEQLAETQLHPVPTFTARYKVEYKGFNVGKEQISVTYDAEQHRYHFESRTQATGLLRIFHPHTVTQRSEFIVHQGTIRPLKFSLDDGTRKGDDNRKVLFHWAQQTAIATHDGHTTRIPLESPTVDPGSLLVSVIWDMEHDRLPGPYQYTDGDAPSTYRYTSEGTETVQVEAGRFATQVLAQHHDDSSRHMRYWLAPKLGYLPVKIVQYDEGERLLRLSLQSVDGHIKPSAE